MPYKDDIEIGQEIYLIYDNTITKLHVYMKGKYDFCHDEAFNQIYKEDFRSPLGYDCYGFIWFTKLNDAKNYLLSYSSNKAEIRKIDKGYWELVESPDDDCLIYIRLLKEKDFREVISTYYDTIKIQGKLERVLHYRFKVDGYETIYDVPSILVEEIITTKKGGEDSEKE